MTYVCIKEFTEPHYNKTIKVGHHVHLGNIGYQNNQVTVHFLFPGTITYHDRFFIAHFKSVNEVREKKLRELLFEELF